MKLASVLYSSIAWTLFWYQSLGLAEFVLYGRLYGLSSLIVFAVAGSFYAYFNGYDTNIYLVDKIKKHIAAKRQKY